MVFKISLKTFSLPATTLPVSKYLLRPEKSPIKPPASLEEMFTASKGQGAYLNEQRIRTTNTRGFENTLIGTGFPFKSPQHLDD
jgi:myo-inositol-1(or 4)-monophosphatase